MTSQNRLVHAEEAIQEKHISVEASVARDERYRHWSGNREGVRAPPSRDRSHDTWKPEIGRDESAISDMNFSYLIFFFWETCGIATGLKGLIHLIFNVLFWVM